MCGNWNPASPGETPLRRDLDRGSLQVRDDPEQLVPPDHGSEKTVEEMMPCESPSLLTFQITLVSD